MHQKHLRLATLTALMLGSATASAIPFSGMDPRSMAMGGAGVAEADPSSAPIFNPALLSTDAPDSKYAFDLLSMGVRFNDPGNMRGDMPAIKDNSTAFQNSTTTLSADSSSLSASTTTLQASTTALNALPALTAANLGTTATQLATVASNMTTVSSNMNTVSTDTSNTSQSLTKMDNSLKPLDGKPLYGDLGLATVLGVPGKNFGYAFFANTNMAMAGSLIYLDSPTIATNTTALNSTSTALTASANAIGAIGTAGTTADLVSLASTAVATANTACNPAPATPAAITACSASLTAAQTALTNANTSMGTTQTTLTNNATTITNNSTTIKNNNQAQSKVRINAALISEAGFSISHTFVTAGHEWALGFSPKFMKVDLYDSLISANSGNLNNANGSQYLAQYSSFNFDLGVAKNYGNGWSTGLVVKNAIPYSFEFKNNGAPTGQTLNLSPMPRFGVSKHFTWAVLTMDADLKANDPVGMGNKSQYVSLGGEASAWGWAQIRAGYRVDAVNNARNVASVGLGLSPRIPYFKPRFDIAVAGNQDEVGLSARLGLKF